MVALLTDFGTEDPYVGVMKAVILRETPGTDLIDLTHQIPPGDVGCAAFRLWQAAPYLPKGSLVLAVVDPGVGTPRRAIAANLGGLRCVGPDNGVFTYLFATRSHGALVEIELPHAGASSTFHGRDVFAPAAARLCAGLPLERLGPPVQDPVLIPMPRLSVDGERIAGEVMVIDRFGNAVTSIGSLRTDADGVVLAPWLPISGGARLRGAAFQVVLATAEGIRLARTFGDVPRGSPLAYIGSDGLLEIAVNGGRAADVLSITVGDRLGLTAL